jgi:Phage integrase, N-terminal SAM-like domain
MARLLDRVREAARRLHYSIRTEEAYVSWTRRFIVFHGKRHPLEMGESEVVAFLTHLAVQRNVAASTQNRPSAPWSSSIKSSSKGRSNGSMTTS